MGGGNAQKAAMKRERKAKEKASGHGSQLKVNEAARNVLCKICRNPFLCTVKLPELQLHWQNKHPKVSVSIIFPSLADFLQNSFEECFPDHAPAAAAAAAGAS